jgi:hypothetical protein
MTTQGDVRYRLDVFRHGLFLTNLWFLCVCVGRGGGLYVDNWRGAVQRHVVRCVACCMLWRVQVIGVARTCSLILVVLDCKADGPQAYHRGSPDSRYRAVWDIMPGWTPCRAIGYSHPYRWHCCMEARAVASVPLWPPAKVPSSLCRHSRGATAARRHARARAEARRQARAQRQARARAVVRRAPAGMRLRWTTGRSCRSRPSAWRRRGARRRDARRRRRAACARGASTVQLAPMPRRTSRLVWHLRSLEVASEGRVVSAVPKLRLDRFVYLVYLQPSAVLKARPCLQRCPLCPLAVDASQQEALPCECP